MKNKERLDQLLLEKQIFQSRESARTAIMDGGIIVNGQKVTKPGQAVDREAKIEVVASYKRCPYVSRGGLKLEKALQTFQPTVKNRICIDAGASTGGFTDCLLKNEAQLVYAIDVGYGQLDWSLRQNERVKVIERTNIRHLKEETLYEANEARATLAVADLSFISITKVLPAIIGLLDQTGYELIILVKPQFEAGKERIEKGGVVRDPRVHKDVLESVMSNCMELGLRPIGLTVSPIKGPSGNIEYLLWLEGMEKQNLTAEKVEASISASLIEQALSEAQALAK